MPHAIMCVQCGASFQRKIPAALAVLILSILLIAATAIGYIVTRETDNPAEIPDVSKINKKTPVSNNKKTNNANNKINDINPPNKKSSNEALNTIINNIILKEPAYNNAINKLAKSASRQNLKKPANIAAKEKVEEDKKESKPPAEKTNVNGFSRSQINRYPVTCTYFIGKNRNNIIFFTTTVLGYLRINGKLYELQGVEKGNDIARFSNAYYDVTIEILGLAGNENEWLATGKLVIMDKGKRILSIHSINSACTDF